jgi:Domain of unknown function (DUF1877)
VGREVTLFSFVPKPELFDGALWKDTEEYSYFTVLRPLQSKALCRCDLDRRFQWLHWTMEKLHPGPLAHWSIYGKEQIAPEAVATQGFPINWNAPRTCAEIASLMQRTDVQHLRSAVNFAEMANAHLYKFGNWNSADNEIVRVRIADDFNALRAFYISVADNAQAALVYQD